MSKLLCLCLGLVLAPVLAARTDAPQLVRFPTAPEDDFDRAARHLAAALKLGEKNTGASPNGSPLANKGGQGPADPWAQPGNRERADFLANWNLSRQSYRRLQAELGERKVPREVADDLEAASRRLLELARSAEKRAKSGQKFAGADPSALLSGSELAEAQMLRLDLAAKEKQARTNAESFASPIPIEIRTLDAAGHEVPNLDVYYRRAFDRPTDGTRFAMRSSPATHELRAGAYYFWCATVGPDAKRGPEVRLPVTGRDTLRFTLTTP